MVKEFEEGQYTTLPENLEGFSIEDIVKVRYDGIYNDDTYTIVIKESIYKGEGEDRKLIGYAHSTFPRCKIDDKTILKSLGKIPLKGAHMWVEEFDENGALRIAQPKVEGEK